MHFDFTRKIGLAAVAASLLLSFSGAAGAHQAMVIGKGVKNDCGKFLEWKQKDVNAYNEVIQWELGYMSGAGMYGPRNYLRDSDGDAVVRWLEEYCTNHLEEDLSDVGDHFMRTHR